MRNDLDEVKIVDLYSDGESPYQIAKRFSTYPNMIRRIVKKNGIELRNSSEAQKNALKNGVSVHPTEGKKRSTEEKINISSGMMKYWDNMSDSERSLRAEVAKNSWHAMSEEKRSRINSLGIKAIRRAAKEGSKLEKSLLKGLTDAGYTVDFHNKNLIPTQELEIDLYIPKLKTIIEVDGPSHFLPIWGEDHLLKQMKYDLTKNGTLLSRGFVVIRVKSIKPLSLKREDDVIKEVVSHLEDIEKNFPEKSKRFIEVEL
jgi:very-short-patch-repair endonuclease